MSGAVETRALLALYRNHPSTPRSERYGPHERTHAYEKRDMLLAWAATQLDGGLLACRNLGVTSLAWIRSASGDRRDDRNRLAALLGNHLHQKGVGCADHDDAMAGVVTAMHRDDAYDIVDFLAGVGFPDARLREAAQAALDLLPDLSVAFHQVGSLRDHADPKDKTGWNLHGIETCEDVYCLDAIAAIAALRAALGEEPTRG